MDKLDDGAGAAFYISILDSNFTIFGPHFRPQITKYGKYGNA